MIIKSVHITTMQGRTWGRVYVQYKVKNDLFYIFKNWLKFDEKTYKGKGLLIDAPIYNKFSEEKRFISDKKSVLEGKMDYLTLTSPEFKEEYGTPSIILKRLLIELLADVGEPIENRDGWYERYTIPEPRLSPIDVLKIKGKYRVYLPAYKTEIEFQPVQKAVFILFLENKSGIKLKEIRKPEVIKELEKWLKRTSIHVQEKDADKLKRLLHPKSNSLNETLAEIKASLIKQLGLSIGKYYFISGRRGEIYSIKLPATMINIKNE